MKKYLFVFLFLFWSMGTHADEGSQLQMELTPKSVFIGTPAHLVYKISRPGSSRIKQKDALKDLEGIEVRDFSLKEQKLGDGRVESIFDYTIISYEPGTHFVPSVSFEVEMNSGKKKVLQSNATSFVIQSLIKDLSRETDIRGPKPQMQLPRSWFPVLVILVFLIFLAVCAWIIARKTRIQSRCAVSQEILLSPDEEAMRQLEVLIASSEMREKNIKAIYIKLTDILRGYLSRRYAFDAREMTTSECLKEMRKIKPAVEIFERVRFLLEKSDLVKFAKWLPDFEMTFDDIEKTKYIVLHTREAMHAS